MSDEMKIRFEKSLPGAKQFHAELVAAASPAEFARISKERFDSLSLINDDDYYDFYLPQLCAVFEFALREMEKNPAKDFEQAIGSFGLYPWSFCSKPVFELAGIMDVAEETMQKRLEAVGYKIEDGKIAHHPSQDVKTAYHGTRPKNPRI